MKSQSFRSNLALLSAALIWGFTFTAQRVGMSSMGPFMFNTVRFIIGTAVLLVMILLLRLPRLKPGELNILARDGALLGLILSAGSAFQQAGLVYTEAGKAGFITGLYVVVVPLMGLLWGKKTRLIAWLGAVLALIGLYLLTITDQFTLELGDGLVLGSTIFWAVHILLISTLSRHHHPLHLAFAQAFFSIFYSLLIAVPFERFTLAGIWEGMIPLLYTGILSTGVAFSLQMIGQKHAHPTSAAIILSMEASFALLGGWLLLGEMLSPRGWLGCALMLAGMILSQLGPTQSPQAENAS